MLHRPFCFSESLSLWPRRLSKGLCFFGTALILLTLVRVVFFYWYRSPEITFDSFLPAFWMGFRVDAKWLSILLLPAWIAFLPAAKWPFCWRVAKGLAGCGLFAAVLLSLVNFGFFGFYATPINAVIFGFLQDDTKAIVKTIWSDWPVFRYFFALVLLTGLPFVLAALIPESKKSGFGWKRYGAAAILLTMAFAVIIRGGFSKFPLRQQDFVVSPIAFVNATVPNGMAALYTAFKGQNGLKLKGGPNEGLRLLGFSSPQNAQQMLAGIRPNIPGGKPTLEKEPHVVLAVMESMGQDLFDLHGEGNNMLGALDGELSHAYVFRRALSIAQGTFPSLEGLLFDTPLVPITQTRYGRQELSFSRALAYKNAGYRTVFLTSGSEKWREMDETFPIQGFDEVIGMGKLQVLYPEAEVGPWGIGDAWMFRCAKTLIEQADEKGQKLFLVMLSATNHSPFKVPDGGGVKSGPVDASRLPDYIADDRQSARLAENLRTYQYAADALGCFVKALRTSNLLERTVVAATGDHSVRFKYAPEGIWHRIQGVPVLFWLPAEMEKQTIKPDTTRWVSHRDIFPTLNGLVLGMTPKSYEGRNLFSGEDFDLADAFGGFGENGFGIGSWGAAAIGEGGALRCYRWEGDRLSVEKQCSSEALRMGNAAKAQRGLADYAVRSAILK